MLRRERSDLQNMRRLLAFTLSPDDNCVDAGAHRGEVLAEIVRVAPRGHHLAFEPLPHLATLLRERFPAVEVHEAALSDRAGKAEFAYVHGSAEGWSGLRFRPLPDGSQAEVETIEVALAALDEVWDSSRRLALVKIDVEGAEQQVLEGAMKTVRRDRPIVLFEHGTGSAETYGTSPTDVFALLDGELGLRVYDLDGSGPYTLSEFERSFYAAERVNFVARR